MPSLGKEEEREGKGGFQIPLKGGGGKPLKEGGRGREGRRGQMVPKENSSSSVSWIGIYQVKTSLQSQYVVILFGTVLGEFCGKKK